MIANAAISAIRRHSSRSKIPKRSYYCKDCKGYHLTSKK